MADPSPDLPPEIDVLQLEYLPLGQYRGDIPPIPGVALFEHDIYFQSIGRLLRRMSNAFEARPGGF